MSFNPLADSSFEQLAVDIAYIDASNRAYDRLDRLSRYADAEFTASFETSLTEVHDHFNVPVHMQGMVQ